MSETDSEHKQLKQHLDANQWDQALKVAFQLLDAQPESSWVHCTMGLIYQKLNELTYAETSLKSAIYYQDTNVEAHTSLGFVYLQMNRIGSADDQCRQALAIDPVHTPAWLLGFKIKLFYSDLPAAREILSTLRRHDTDEAKLRSLEFDLICHPQNKDTIDYQSEITKRETLLDEKQSDSQANEIHAELAYLHQKHSNDLNKAEYHIEKALKSLPIKPLTLITYAQIKRKKPLWLRVLTAPYIAATRPKDTSPTEVGVIGIIIVLLFVLASFGNVIDSQSPWIVHLAIFSLIGMFFISYTSFRAFFYLLTTETLHKLGKPDYFKGSLDSIHKLPYEKRRLVIVSLTFISWLALAGLIYLLIR